MIEGILVEGLIYGLMALGVFITFRILDFPDLTVDGSFPLGAAAATMLLVRGTPWGLALPAAFAAGFGAGTVTALIHNKLKVPNLLAGILTMTMLYSVNIRVLGNKANVPLLNSETAITWFTGLTEGVLSRTAALVVLFALIIGLFKALLDLFFHTDMGITLGAMGDNEQMVISQGVNPEVMKIIGVGLSNGLVAVSGAFAAQYLGFADVSMGTGIVVAGLASVMIGEFLLSSNRIGLLTLRVLLGSILFRGLMFLGRYYGYYIRLTPNDLKLITGLLIILSLAVSRRKEKRAGSRARWSALKGWPGSVGGSVKGLIRGGKP